MTEKIAVTVDWTPALLGAGSKAFQKRQQRKIGWKTPALLVFVFIFVVFGVFQLLERVLLKPEHDTASFEAGVGAGMVQVVVFLVLFFIAILIVNRQLRRAFYRGSPIFERPWTIQLSVEGMRTQGPYTYGHTDWAAVVDVLETKTATIISLGAGGFVPLPNDGLPDGVSQAELLRRIDAWRAAADF